jgi:hypothetical protein
LLTQDFQKISRKVEAVIDLTKAPRFILTIEFQDFKKSLRGPDSARSGRSGNLFRASNSLGSLGALFSSNPKKRRGIPPHLSKSEETLDSMKQSISDTEDSVSDTVNVSENQSDTEEHSSPVRARKPRK